MSKCLYDRFLDALEPYVQYVFVCPEVEIGLGTPRDPILMHAFGYFSKQLSVTEKAFFLDLLEKYRDHRIPLSSVTTVLKSWLFRVDVRYL